MLSLLSYLYGKLTDLRNVLYDRGVFEVHDLGARTISVGNITTGGTGKTPLVAYIAELLLERGEKVGILTRGYGRDDAGTRVLVSDGKQLCENDARKCGDESLELAQKLEARAVIIADADRAASAEWARRKFGVTAFLLDDAFQHRKAARNVDIVCVDATDPFGKRAMLPKGRLREHAANLARADAIVITRPDLVAEQALAELRSEVASYAPNATVFECRTKLAGLRPIGPTLDGAESKDEKLFAFCGLGNPESFFAMLRSEGLALAGTHAFPDHHRYSQRELHTLSGEALALGATALVTTRKDAVKVNELDLGMPCYSASMEIVIDDPERFGSMITRDGV